MTAQRPRLASALSAIDAWGAGRAAAAVVTPAGSAAQHGDPERPLAWASVTKLLTATAVWIAAERGLLALDERAGPPGARVRHLLAHASRLSFEGDAPGAQAQAFGTAGPMQRTTRTGAVPAR